MAEQTEAGGAEHFDGKSAVEHLKERHAQGVLGSAEMHGMEVPGHVNAALDSAKDITVALLLLFLVENTLGVTGKEQFVLSIGFCVSWVLWKAGRSCHIAWQRLERLHRLLEEERYEIEHHRDQERFELAALYRLKGFEGKLLDDVLDVLMADGDRLLRIMLEEELGLTLGTVEHPLKQGLWALLGGSIAGMCMLGAFFYAVPWCFYAVAFFIIGASSVYSAKYAKNNALNACLWSLATAALIFEILSLILGWIV